ncbi:MAG: ROK family protein [Bacteroides sp.]|jgi:glucokinase|nr:ROK family protein [Bacteroides sp.]
MKKVIAGVDIGGTSIKAGLFSEKMEFLKRFCTPVRREDHPEISLQKLISWIIKSSQEDAYRLAAAAAGIPGIFDQERGMLSLAANLPLWVEFPVRDYLKEKLHVPVSVGNDGNMAALGEYHAGSGKNLRSMVMLTLGTGVGGAIIDKGKILEFNHFSGEIGHMIIDMHGAKCHCGRRGCLETMAAKSGLMRMLDEELKQTTQKKDAYLSQTKMTPLKLSELAAAGDPIAMKVYQKSGEAVGIGLANVLNILRLDGVVIGGGIAGAWDGFFQVIEETIAKTAFDYQPEKIKIKKASLGENAGIFGSAVTAWESIS